MSSPVKKHYILYDAANNTILDMSIVFFGNLGYGQISSDGKTGTEVIVEDTKKGMKMHTSLLTINSEIFMIGDV
jgi:hypothetical protein